MNEKALSGLMDKMLVHKTGYLRFKSRLRHKFFSQYLSLFLYLCTYEILTLRFNINTLKIRLQSMRNNLRQNFQERQKMCLPPLSLLRCWRLWCYPSSISVKETVAACSTVEWPLILPSSLFLTIHISMCGSPGDVSEEPVPQEKRKKGWRMNCDIGEAMEELENELWCR